MQRSKEMEEANKLYNLASLHKNTSVAKIRAFHSLKAGLWFV
jgi:hypothetical protein